MSAVAGFFRETLRAPRATSALIHLADAFAVAHGHAADPAVWLKNQRAAAHRTLNTEDGTEQADGSMSGSLSAERRGELNDIDASWCPAWPVARQRCFHLARTHLSGGGSLPEERAACSSSRARTSAAGHRRSAPNGIFWCPRGSGCCSPRCSDSSPSKNRHQSLPGQQLPRGVAERRCGPPTSPPPASTHTAKAT